MSQENNPTTRKGLSARSVVLVILLIGAGASLTVYALSNAFGATNNTPSQNTSNGNTTQWLATGPRDWHRSHNGNFLGFRALSTVNNVSVTGFQITDTNHMTVTLAYGGTGSSPAITIVGLAPELSGSTTLSAGWGTSTTVSLHLIGQGTLTGSTFVRVAIVPLTGA